MIEEQLFHQALEQPEDQRASFLDAACKGDADLRERVQVLLRAHADPGSFLEFPRRGAAPTIDHPSPELPGIQIGPYKRLEQIGEGGMGVVYVASQKEPLRRKVALKIIKPGMDTREVVARFEAERQALALMDHPNIAKVFDAGATDAGRPYFAMELVKGTPITEYCDREQLSTRERLALFVTLCHGVQHAHQKGVIHRDLKPSNLLVEVDDVRPVPKIIDFGIAKAVGQQLTEKTFHTAQTQMVGTPLYMSPEQAGQSCTDVDTRSDIYSLGVLLYELLTGHTPFEKDTLRTAGFDEMRRIIREVEPPRPSARVSTLQAADLSTISEHRHIEPGKLSQQLRGELDWIVMKAMDKDRDRRYATANDLAADVERYLRDEPVEACPPSSLYRLGKFARRHRVGLATTIIVSLTLIIGLSLALWQARVARQAATRANTENDRAQKTLSLALDTVDEIYATVADEHYENEPVDDPIRLEVLAKTRTFYEGLVQVNPTDFQLQQQQASAYRRLGSVYEQMGDYVRAASAYQQGAARYQELVRDRPSELEYRRQLGQCYMSKGWILCCTNRKVEAIALLDQAVLTFADLAVAAPDNADYATDWAHALSKRGLWYYDTGRPHESLDDFRLAFQVHKPIVAASPERPWPRFILALAYHNYAMALTAERQFDQAEQYYRLALEQRERLLEDQSANPTFRWHYAMGYQCLAESLAGAEQYDDALVACRRSNELHQALAGDCPKVPLFRMSYVQNLLTSARVMEQFDDWIAVDQHYRQAVEQAETLVALSDQDVRFCGTWAHACRKCSDFFMGTDQYEDAEKLYRTMLSRLEKLIAGAPGNVAYRSSYVTGILNMTMLLARDGRYDEVTSLHHNAVRVLDDALAALADKNVYSGKDRGLALNNLAWLLSATPVEALRDPVESLLLAHEAVRLDPGGHTWNTLGLACYRAGQFPEAIDALEKAVNTMKDWGWGYGYNAFPLAMLHHCLGNEEEAYCWYENGAARMDQQRLYDSTEMRLRREAAELLGIEDTHSDLLQSTAKLDTEPVEQERMSTKDERQ